MIDAKYQKLQDLLRSYGRVVIAYSGGVDSSFLAYAAHQALGNDALNVTAVSETYPESERQSALALARQFGLNHRVIRTEELKNDSFLANPPDRCYHCKTELFKKLKNIADKENIKYVADGTTLSDAGDYRPGRRAACELQVVSPLVEAGLTKEEVRSLSRTFGLPTWDKPAYACLASRFPYGEQLAESKLQRVEQAEEFIRALGFKTLRVRSHGNIARIEIEPAQFQQLLELREQVVNKLSALGYKFVTLDLEGYRSGSMNRELNAERERSPERSIGAERESLQDKLRPESGTGEERTSGRAEMSADNSTDISNCPNCTTEQLTDTVNKAGSYKQCGHCGGVWFGINELEKALGSKARFNIPADLPANTASKSRIDCPVCNSGLIKVRSMEQPHAEAYACTICQGRWVQGAEIVRLQERGLFNKMKNFVMRLF